MSNPCNHAERQIQLLIDGRITPAERRVLDRHLSGCPACAAMLDDYRTLSQGITSWAAPKAADDPGDIFNAAVLRSLAVPAPALGQHGWLSLASAAALLGAGGGLWRLTSPSYLPTHLFDMPLGITPQVSRILAFPTSVGHWMPFDLQILPRFTPVDFSLAAAAALLINAWFIYRMVGGRQASAR